MTYLCVGICVPMHVLKPARMLGVCLYCFPPFPVRKGLSMNLGLELSQAVTCMYSNSPVSKPLRAGVAGVSRARSLICVGAEIQTGPYDFTASAPALCDNSKSISS